MPGYGLIDYRAHFAALRRIGYAGNVSLEPHIPAAGLDEKREIVTRCKEAVEFLWTQQPEFVAEML